MKPHSGLHPRCVEKANEYERQYDQKQHNTGQENHNTEHATNITVEGDVAEAEGRHDG
ncbi:MAG: hypothetical protein V2I50_05455 [Desulfuromusa sp.]|nr:hypothetical protein [Desulfuromusa sp.]